MRRFTRANALRYLWTLTYAVEPADRAGVGRDLRRFQGRLQSLRGRMPLLAVIEQGSLNGRLHVHLACDRRLPIKLVRQVWARGYVWVGDGAKVKGRLPVRALARYLSKYLAKQIDSETAELQGQRLPGAHRYYVTQGWQPECRRRVFGEQREAATWLLLQYGVADVNLWWGERDGPWLYGCWLSYPDPVIDRWLAPWRAYLGAAGP